MINFNFHILRKQSIFANEIGEAEKGHFTFIENGNHGLNDMHFLLNSRIKKK